MGIHSPNLLTKNCVLQNKAVRIIGGGSYHDHVTTYYYKLKILKLPDLCKLETAKVSGLQTLSKKPSSPNLKSLYQNKRGISKIH